MKRILFLLLTVLFVSNPIVAQSNGVLCGQILETKSNIPLSFVNIWVENTVIGTNSDSEGNFCIHTNEISKDSIVLVISFLSYKSVKQKVSLIDNKDFIVFLSPVAVQLDEIIVSSNKNSNSIRQQTTLPVILTKSSISESVSQNIPDLLIKQPGISLAGTGYHKAPSIRGLARKRVLVMVDGEKVSSDRNVGAPGTFVNPNEIQKIEILKGPYSTLYGSDAIGGIVNIITKKYDTPYYNEKLGGQLDLSYRSISKGKNANLSLNGKFNKIKYRISSGYRDADNYVEGDGEEAFNSFFKEKHIAGNLNFEINNNNNLSFKSYYSNGGPIGFPAHSVQVNSIHDYDDHFVVGINHKMNNIGKYLKKVELNITRHTHDLGADILVHKKEIDPNEDKLVNLRKDLKSVDYSTQLDMYFTINEKFKVLTGFDGFLRENIDVRAKKIASNYHTGTFIAEIVDVSLSNASQRSYGIFSQVDYTLSNQIYLNGGLRWNYMTTKQPDKIDQNKSNKALSGNFGLSYIPIKKFSIKANIGSAFRVPDIKELYVTTQTPGGLNISNSELYPEQSLNLDLSFVYQGNSNLVQLAFFQNRINGMIILDWDYTTNPRTGTYENIGGALLYGVEFSYNQKIMDNFFAYGNVTKIYGFDVVADDKLMDIPPLQANIGLRYNYKNTLWFNLSGRYSDDQLDVAPGGTPSDHFTTFDFSTRWMITPNINMNFAISNIMNKAYREHFHFDWIQSPGRSFNLGLRFNF